MPGISQFSTPENFAKLNDSLAKLSEAIREAQIAVQAGIPGADLVLANAKDAEQRVLLLKNTYFPQGMPQ
jgi:hypothetical protein